MSENTFDDVSQGKYRNYFKGLYERNKNLLIITTAIFFLSVFVGYLISGSLDQIMKTVFSTLKGKFSKEGINTLSIFLNNLKVAFMMYFGGIIIGIGTLLILFSNGIIIGYVLAKFPLFMFIVYIVPHGIFEIPALILAAVAGFRIAKMLIGMLISLINGKPISDHYWEFKDSLVIFGISILLFFIAAVIEANITLHLGNYIKV